jgi:hypothetical protein
MTRHPIAQIAQNGNHKSPKNAHQRTVSCKSDYFETATGPVLINRRAVFHGRLFKSSDFIGAGEGNRILVVSLKSQS